MSDLGYTIDDLLTKNLPKYLEEATPSFQNSFSEAVGPSTLGSGTFASSLEIGKDGNIRSGQTDYDTGTGFWLGNDAGTPKFSIGNSAGNKMTWDGTTLTVSGAFSASTIDIGGADASSFHVDIDGNMWLGAATFAAAPLKASNAGVLTASGVIISGALTTGASSSIDGQYLLAASVASAAANLAMRGWTQTSAFTVTDADTVAWGAGTFTASDGTAYSITGSNTGNMAAKTFIYLDIAVSTTAYQTTTTAATAVGNGKVLVAIAQNGTGEASFLVLNNNSYNIDASNIVASSITANEIAATTITGTQIASLSISGKSITADTGTIGGWTLSSSTLTTTAGGNTVTLSTGTNALIAGTTGSPQFILTQAGALTATSATITGAITATSGTIGGWTIDADEIKSGSFKLESDAETLLVGAATAPLTGVGIFIGKDGSDYEIRAGDPASQFFHWDGTNLNITGAIQAAATINGSTASVLQPRAETLYQRLVFLGDSNDVMDPFATGAGASVTRDIFFCSLTTGTGGTGHASLHYNGSLSSITRFDWTQNPELFFFADDSGITANASTFMGLDSSVADDNGVADAGTYTAEHAAFIITATATNKVYASSSDGATQQTTDITGSVTVTNMNSYRIVVTDAANVKFYVNDVLLATHSTNPPGGATSDGVAIRFAVDQTSTNAKTLKFGTQYTLFSDL